MKKNKILNYLTLNLCFQLLFCNILVADNFWIGIKIPQKEVDFSRVQKFLKNKLTPTLSTAKIKKKFPVKPTNVKNWGFEPNIYLHITLAEGQVNTKQDKKAIDRELKKIKFKPIKNLAFKPGATILGGKDKKFITLEIDKNKNSDLYNLANDVNAKISKLNNNNILLVNHTNIILHISIGTIYPSYTKLKKANFKRIINNVRQVISKVNVNNPKSAPYLSKMLNKYKINNFEFVVTPNIILSKKQRNNPKYIYAKYLAK